MGWRLVERIVEAKHLDHVAVSLLLVLHAKEASLAEELSLDGDPTQSDAVVVLFGVGRV